MLGLTSLNIFDRTGREELLLVTKYCSSCRFKNKFSVVAHTGCRNHPYIEQQQCFSWSVSAKYSICISVFSAESKAGKRFSGSLQTLQRWRSGVVNVLRSCIEGRSYCEVSSCRIYVCIHVFYCAYNYSGLVRQAGTPRVGAGRVTARGPGRPVHVNYFTTHCLLSVLRSNINLV